LGNYSFQQRVDQQVLWYIGRGAMDQAESLQGTMFRVMMPPLYGGEVVVGGVSVSFPPGQPLPYIHPQSTFWQDKRARMAPVAADGAEPDLLERAEQLGRVREPSLVNLIPQGQDLHCRRTRNPHQAAKLDRVTELHQVQGHQLKPLWQNLQKLTDEPWPKIGEVMRDVGASTR
jgi:hypothetical protein